MSQPPKQGMANPYENYDAHPDKVLVQRWLVGLFLALFLSAIILPPLWRNLYEASIPTGWVPAREFFHHPSPLAQSALQAKRAADPRVTRNTPDLLDHIQSFEKKLESSSVLASAARRDTQFWETKLLREGNRKTLIGKDGWLFFRPAVEALTGYGPLNPEPATVAKDPTHAPWEPPLAAVLDFQKQLEAIGVELILVPIPVKPQIYPEMLGDTSATVPLIHADAAAFYQELEQFGVKICDLGPAMVTWKKEGVPVFLKQDTHWTPEGMERSARFLAEYLRQRPWFASLTATPRSFDSLVSPVAHTGDLVEKLDLPAQASSFLPELTTAHQVIDKETGKPVITQDWDSPIVLLGDSFTNIFSLENMGWGSGAGFAQHLTKELGFTLDVIAQNGQASSGVRETLARRPGSRQWIKETKKAVIWAIASRDLFLSETLARENEVAWHKVSLTEGAREDGFLTEDQKPVTLKGKLIFKSPIDDPAQVPYDTALFASVYEVREVLEGTYESQTIKVVQPAFIKRQLTEASSRTIGTDYTLRLIPFGKTGMEGLNMSDEVEDALLLPYFEESSAGSGGSDGGWNTQAVSTANGFTALGGLAIIGFSFLLTFRRRSD